MTNYYVSPSGSDSNHGSSESAPFQTLAFAESKVDDGTIATGDCILFQRDQEFSGVLTPLAAYATTGKRLTYGAYGYGADPIITPYKFLNTALGWTGHASGIWKIDLTNSSTHTGYNTLSNVNIGHLIVDGELKAVRVDDTSELADPWDFYCDSTYLYVKASANPTTLSDDIRAAPKPTSSGNAIVYLRNSVAVVGLDLRGSGGCGIDGVGQNVRVFGNKIHHNGGSLTGANERYGNGLNGWMVGTVKDWLAEGNDIYQNYDAGYSLQGFESNGDSFENCHFRNNRLWANSQNMEFWARADDGGTAPGFVNCSVTDNQCFDAGMGWSSPVRSSPEVEAHLLVYTWGLPGDLTMERNLFHGAADHASFYVQYASSVPDPTEFVRRNNTIAMPEGTQIARYIVEDTETSIDDAQTWATSEGVEDGSTFVVLPSTSPASVSDAQRDVAAQSQSNPIRHDSSRRHGSRLRTALELLQAKVAPFTDLPITLKPATTTSSNVLAIRRPGDTQDRIAFTDDGYLKFGTGSASPAIQVNAATQNLALWANAMRVTRGAATTCWQASTTGDGQPRWEVLSSGAIQWGDGTNALDTNLYRSAVSLLKTDDSFQILGDLILTARTPASAAATGTAGMVAVDANYIYVCTATDTWKRVAISTW